MPSHNRIELGGKSLNVEGNMKNKFSTKQKLSI